MKKRSTAAPGTQPVDISSLDLTFRPTTYWNPEDRWKRILANIKGAERRRWVKQALASGGIEDVEEWMLLEKLPDHLRTAVGSIHPHYMGGEYLPDCGPKEVEIARVTLQSCTQDVMSVRARPVGNRIRYRIVHEYETTWKISPASSARPLSMQELIHLMDNSRTTDYDDISWKSGVVWGPLSMNLESSDDPLELLEFVEVTSEFYDGLQQYYAAEIERYLTGRRQ